MIPEGFFLLVHNLLHRWCYPRKNKTFYCHFKCDMQAIIM